MYKRSGALLLLVFLLLFSAPVEADKNKSIVPYTSPQNVNTLSLKAQSEEEDLGMDSEMLFALSHIIDPPRFERSPEKRWKYIRSSLWIVETCQVCLLGLIFSVLLISRYVSKTPG